VKNDTDCTQRKCFPLDENEEGRTKKKRSKRGEGQKRPSTPQQPSFWFVKATVNQGEKKTRKEVKGKVFSVVFHVSGGERREKVGKRNRKKKECLKWGGEGQKGKK